ncbi:hypothetical protein BDY17DRAFT_305048 [Neohortaea acidophila]|uniref:Stc1 domain-containing protein n=1 Tax=Neohortaea acidophila TaxID=245834 RepID=A0A6A6PHW3_9PEZI|nr:uncharacterized protein BDY17DRAFT_305048 [Neohortaea acidophila]KAF2479143.1 hypothetical protein BDY17DRAFT_305048 [Neohortaea acidophila]
MFHSVVSTHVSIDHFPFLLRLCHTQPFSSSTLLFSSLVFPHFSFHPSSFHPRTPCSRPEASSAASRSHRTATNVIMARGKWSNGNMGGHHYARKITVPEGMDIRCAWCNVKKNKGAFSQKSIDQIEARMSDDRSFDPAEDAIVPCTWCRNGGGDEYKCNGCNKWMAKTRFSRQERNKDDRRCVPCVDEDMASDHDNNSGHDDEGGEDEDNVGGGGGSTNAGTGTLASGLSAMSVSDNQAGGVALSNSAGSDYGTNTSTHWASGTSTGGVLVGAPSAPATFNSSRSNGLPGGFNPNGYKSSSKSAAASTSRPSGFAKPNKGPKRNPANNNGSHAGGDEGGVDRLDGLCAEESEPESEED